MPGVTLKKYTPRPLGAHHEGQHQAFGRAERTNNAGNIVLSQRSKALVAAWFERAVRNSERPAVGHHAKSRLGQREAEGLY